MLQQLQVGMEERQTKTRTRTNPDPDQPGPGPGPTQITVIVITDPPTKMEEDAARCQIKGFVILRTPRQRRREAESQKRWPNAKGLNLEGGGPARRGSTTVGGFSGGEPSHSDV